MASLIQIARGWKNMIELPVNLVPMVNTRLEVCDTCPHKRQLGPTGQALITLMNSNNSIFYCGICNCPLASKLSLPGSTCPDSRWKEWKEEPEQSFY